MANVIDRLRVQGNPAPRNLPDPAGLSGGLTRKLRKGGEGTDRDSDQPTVQVIIRHPHLQNTETNSGRRMNQTARRLDHLHRVQHANQGLSTMDVRQPDLHGKQFLLRGKPASAEVALLNRHNLVQQQLQHQEQAGSAGSGSGQSSRRKSRFGQSHSDTEGILPRSRRQPNPVRCRGARTDDSSDVPVPASGHSLPASADNTSSYFVPGNPNTVSKGSDPRGPSPVVPGSRTSARRQAYDPKSAGSAATFELTGRQVVTPRANGGFDDGINLREFYTRSPRYGRPGFKSPGLKDASQEPSAPDPESLQECLHVQPSAHTSFVNLDPSGEAALKLRRFGGPGAGGIGGGGLHSSGSSSRPPGTTGSIISSSTTATTRHPGTTETKINYNNPYRQVRSKERKPLPESERRYIFDSVASYIHFNKIYPQRKDAAASSALPPGMATQQSPSRRHHQHHHNAKLGLGGVPVKEGGGIPTIPHMTGFPSHCTDTILLRMMFEMNKPGTVHGIGLGHPAAGAPSIRSSVSNKYSDVGRHRDLDEFLIRGETPSTASIRNSGHHHHNQPPPVPQTSQRSGGTISFHAIPSPPKEEDEEDAGLRSGQGFNHHHHRHRYQHQQQQEQDPGDETDTDLEAGLDTKRTLAEEEDESTLRTATTPGRHPADEDDEDDENAGDADDEASEWTVRVAGKGVKGGGGGGSRGVGEE